MNTDIFDIPSATGPFEDTIDSGQHLALFLTMSIHWDCTLESCCLLSMNPTAQPEMSIAWLPVLIVPDVVKSGGVSAGGSSYTAFSSSQYDGLSSSFNSQTCFDAQ